MKIYTLTACEKYIDKYINKYKGEVLEIKEGILGLGTVLLFNAKGKKTVIIKEIYLSAWSSGHTVRMYNKIPKKYLELINN